MSATRTMCVVALSTILFSTTASAEEKRELGAHEHGHAKIELAVEGDTIALELDVPGASIVGFEYAAKTDEEKAAVEAAIQQLSDPAALFTFTAEAGCTGSATDVELHQDGDHNAFEAAYTFTCTGMNDLKGMETALFALYPSIDEIDVDYITPDGQGSAELEAGATAVTF